MSPLKPIESVTIKELAVTPVSPKTAAKGHKKKDRGGKIFSKGKVVFSDGAMTNYQVIETKKRLHMRVRAFRGDKAKKYLAVKEDLQKILDVMVRKQVLNKNINAAVVMVQPRRDVKQEPVTMATKKQNKKKKLTSMKHVQKEQTVTIDSKEKEKDKKKKQKTVVPAISLAPFVREKANIKPWSPVHDNASPKVRFNFEEAFDVQIPIIGSPTHQYYEEPCPLASPKSKKAEIEELRRKSVSDWTTEDVMVFATRKKSNPHLIELLGKKDIDGEKLMAYHRGNLKVKGIKKDVDQEGLLSLQKQVKTLAI